MKTSASYTIECQRCQSQGNINPQSGKAYSKAFRARKQSITGSDSNNKMNFGSC
jgi:hypothetical protein